MTYGEKYKEVFGYYPEKIPCPTECPDDADYCTNCKFNTIRPETVFTEDTEDEEKEADRPCDRRNLSPVDIYHYLRTASASEYGVIYSIVAIKMFESMDDFEDFLTLVFANLFAVSDKFDPEVMYKAQQMILKHYEEEE